MPSQPTFAEVVKQAQLITKVSATPEEASTRLSKLMDGRSLDATRTQVSQPSPAPAATAASPKAEPAPEPKVRLKPAAKTAMAAKSKAAPKAQSAVAGKHPFEDVPAATPVSARFDAKTSVWSDRRSATPAAAGTESHDSAG